MNLTAVLVVLLALQTPVLALATFQVWKPSEHVRAGGNLEDSGFAVDLLQYHHVNSPYATPNLTLSQRVEIAVKSSLERAQGFVKRAHGKSSSERLSTDVVVTSPVYSVQGEYVMQIALGTPAKTFFALADTGSDLVWVQCSTCTDCFSEPDPIFVPSSSSSYRTRPCNDSLCSTLSLKARGCSAQNTCVYAYGYGDRSYTRGDLASETVSLTSTSGSNQSFPGIAFGCGHNNSGTPEGVSDGIVGLGQGPLSLVSQLGPQINNVFSYCLVSFYTAQSKTSQLLLGSTGTTTLTYTPLLTNSIIPSHYYVNLTGITVAGVALSYPSAAFTINATGYGGILLDSGTTFTRLDFRAYTPFLNRIASLITYTRVNLSSTVGLDLCYDVSDVSNPTLPAVVFNFINLNLALPDDNVFLRVDTVPHICLAFLGADLGFSIFGNVQQQNFQIAYDRANKQVGFAPKTC